MIHNLVVFHVIATDYKYGFLRFWTCHSLSFSLLWLWLWLQRFLDRKDYSEAGNWCQCATPHLYRIKVMKRPRLWSKLQTWQWIIAKVAKSAHMQEMSKEKVREEFPNPSYQFKIFSPFKFLLLRLPSNFVNAYMKWLLIRLHLLIKFCKCLHEVTPQSVFQIWNISYIRNPKS